MMLYDKSCFPLYVLCFYLFTQPFNHQDYSSVSSFKWQDKAAITDLFFRGQSISLRKKCILKLQQTYFGQFYAKFQEYKYVAKVLFLQLDTLQAKNVRPAVQT